MRFLFINSVCGVGSTGKICTDLANVLEKEGNVVKIAYGRSCAKNGIEKYAVKIGNDFGVKINALKARLFDNEGFNAKLATKKFIKWVREYKPDVIHLHNLHGYYLNVKILFEYLKNEFEGKVIWTLHDEWAFTGHSACCNFPKCDKWKCGCDKCLRVKDYPKAYRDNSKKNWQEKKQVFCGVKNLTIVTPSNWLKEKVENSFLNEYKVKVINNGIDTSVFCKRESCFRDEHDLENKKIILGVASVWYENKGLKDFISLSKLLSDNQRIVLVGLSKKQIKDLPLSIVGIEKTENAIELAKIYSTADLFFNPTYEDNYPTVNLEAQACGTGVVTYKTGGSVESVDKENVIEVGDYKKVLDYLKREVKISNQDFSKSKMLKEYKEIY